MNAQKADFSTITFEKADKIALEYKNETLTNLPELAYKLTSDLATDVERFRAIFKWVCSNARLRGNRCWASNSKAIRSCKSTYIKSDCSIGIP